MRRIALVIVAVLAAAGCSTTKVSTFSPPPQSYVPSPSSTVSIYPVPSPTPPRSPRPVMMPTSPAATSPVATSPSPSPGSPTSQTFSLEKGKTSTATFTVKKGAVAATFTASWTGAGSVRTAVVTPGGTTVHTDAVGGSAFHQASTGTDTTYVSEPKAGVWKLRLTGTRIPPKGLSVTAGFQQTVTKSGKAPAARFTTSKKALAVTVDASGSKPSQGTKLVVYRWDFGDETWSTGAKVSHTYKKAGTYVVRLLVEDSSGAIGVSSSSVTVT